MCFLPGDGVNANVGNLEPHSIKAAIERNELFTTKRPVEFIKRNTASPSLRIAM